MVMQRTFFFVWCGVWNIIGCWKSFSLPTVQLATYLAVGQFNDGCKIILSVLENLGIDPEVHLSKASKKIDKDGIRHSRRKSSDISKRCRRKIRQAKRGYNETQEAKETPV